MERVQRRATRLVDEIRTEPYSERLRLLGLPSLYYRRRRGDMIAVFQMLTDVKFHGHVQSVAHKAGGLAENLLKSTVCRTPRFMLLLLTTHIRPILEYCSCVWNTGYVQDIYLLERVQRRWTKHIDGMEGFSYGERLKHWTFIQYKAGCCGLILSNTGKSSMVILAYLPVTCSSVLPIAEPEGTVTRCSPHHCDRFAKALLLDSLHSTVELAACRRCMCT